MIKTIKISEPVMSVSRVSPAQNSPVCKRKRVRNCSESVIMPVPPTNMGNAGDLRLPFLEFDQRLFDR